MQASICTDDFGNGWYCCHWTGELVSAPDAVTTGGFYPGVKEKYIAIKKHVDAKKASKKAFDEMDRNCNACVHLSRTPHQKSKHGLLHGLCAKTQKEIQFHPDDCMLMPCWEGRE